LKIPALPQDTPVDFMEILLLAMAVDKIQVLGVISSSDLRLTSICVRPCPPSHRLSTLLELKGSWSDWRSPPRRRQSHHNRTNYVCIVRMVGVCWQ